MSPGYFDFAGLPIVDAMTAAERADWRERLRAYRDAELAAIKTG